MGRGAAQIRLSGASVDKSVGGHDRQSTFDIAIEMGGRHDGDSCSTKRKNIGKGFEARLLFWAVHTALLNKADRGHRARMESGEGETNVRQVTIGF